MLRFLLAIFMVSMSIATRAPARAGAFLLPEGQGQFIAGVGYSQGSRRFDPAGAAVPTPTFRKAEASGYIEYGLTPWLSLVAAPTLSHANETSANSVTGSDSSAFGARLRLFEKANTVMAVQALLQPPIGGESEASEIADGGARAFAADLRVLFGRSINVFGLPAFVDVEPGARLRAAPFPTEARLDLTFGVRPVPRVLLLLQDFSAFAGSAGPLIQRCGYSKLQASVVYDLSRTWSVQAGGFWTVAGMNAIREMGPLAALWYRF